MRKRKSLLEELQANVTANPVTNEIYQRELARLRLANQILEVRHRAGLSQEALAERIGTKQSAVARMERGGYTGYTVSTLAKIAAATGLQLDVRFVGRPRQRRRH